MSAGSWALYLGLLLGAAGFVLWLYLRREVPGRGRPVLAALRLAVFAILLLLLFDPSLPVGTAGAGRSRHLLLLDASASMALPAGDAPTRWDAARREAQRRQLPVLLFGDAPRPLAADSLPPAPPGDLRSLLRPALAAAAEAGAERVTVLTDGALEDAALLPGWIARLGLAVEWVQLGGATPGLALTALTGPGWARAGGAVPLEAELAAGPGAPDSVRLVVRQAGRVIAEASVRTPPPGRSATVRLEVRPVAPAAPGHVRLDVSLEPGDVVPDDDRRALSLFLAPDPAGVALVSLQPDWEPRFLLPVLQRALGLPARGFLRVGDGWVRVAQGAEAGERVADADVARTVAGAELVVVHAPGANPPPWLIEALRTAPRLLVLPATAPLPPLPLPLEIGPAEAADWFVAAEVPASPVAVLLEEVPATELVPLPSLRRPVRPPDAWAPLAVTRGRGGDSSPLLLAAEAEGRRWAVALGDGYWRWAFPGGESRALYERLWAAVGGWLLQEAAVGTDGVRPARRVLGRGELPLWLTPGLRADSVRLRLSAAGDVRDTLLLPAVDDSVRGPALPPGEYRYAATAFAPGVRATGGGELFVERYTPEFARPVASLRTLAGRRAPGRIGSDARDRPLHTSPLPWIAIVLLLATEWILRRRWGLR